MSTISETWVSLQPVTFLPSFVYPSPTEGGFRMGDENDFCLHHHHLCLPLRLPIWQRLASSEGGSRVYRYLSWLLLCLRASQFRKCTINLRTRLPTPMHARRRPCQFLAQEMVPCLSALIVERKPSFLGGIPGMPVVVDRTRGNTG